MNKRELLNALLDAEKRITPFAKCWSEESTMEEAITLDDLALADAWLDQNKELIAEAKKIVNG